MKNILIVGAHYDDVELGCGGTAAKLSRMGCKVYKIILTDNEFDSESMNLSIRKSTCVKSSERACGILGINELQFSQAPYGQLVYNQNIMQNLENIIIEKQIDTIITHYSSDMHHDHEEAFKICKTAGRHCDNILTYQSNGYITDRQFTPNLFVDISDVIDKKIQSLKVYEEDEKEQNRQGRLFDICIMKNNIWGYANHVKYAEGFEIVKQFIR